MFRKKIEADLDFLSWYLDFLSWYLRFSQLKNRELRYSVLQCFDLGSPL
jgi:hypothetical protein